MTGASPPPDGRTFVRTILVRTNLFVLASILIISLYLRGLLSLRAEQWWGFAGMVGAALVFVFPAMVATHWRVFRQIQVGLDGLGAGRLSPAELRAGFRAVANFPAYWFLWGKVWWGLGGLAVGLGMLLRYDDFGALQLAILVAATLSAAFVTDTAYFFVIKREIEPVRLALADALADPDLRASLVRPIGLRSKLMTAIGSVIVVTVVFASLLAHVRTTGAVRNTAARAQARFLEALDAERGLEPRGAAALVARFGAARDLLVLDADGEHLLWGDERGLTASERRWLAERGRDIGDSRGLTSQHAFAWQRLPDGRLLVLSTPTSALLQEDTGLGLFLGLLGFSCAVALGVSLLLARDVGHSAERVRVEAERIASGDLTERTVCDTEDELGDLARAFERMAGALRDTVGQVAGAAERVEGAVRQIAGAGDDVTRVSAEQVGGIGQARAAVGTIDAQARGITGSASDLSANVEETSSVAFELDATSEELAEIAALLQSNIENVAGAVEQMSRSIGQVARSSDSLARLADDASSNMERNARSARSVDDHASETARLAEQVVALSEQGRERVRETIRGMEDIHRATDSAESVIRRLSESSKAIDGVVNVIDEVADETNLLALNAAIIAAQAGERGRAFAVVADQIKALADRVLSSTKEISGLVRSLQDEARDAEGAISEGSRSVHRGVDLAGEAGVALEAITSAARTAGGRVTEIVGSAREQSRSTQHVVQLMQQVREGTGQIRSAILEQGAGVGHLRQSAQSVGDLSRQVKASTEEQSGSAGHIKRSVHQVREAMEQIERALREQTASCQDTVSRLDHLASGARSNERSVHSLEGALQELEREAEGLRAQVRRFRI